MSLCNAGKISSVYNEESGLWPRNGDVHAVEVLRIMLVLVQHPWRET